jgi:uncharacterized membrane protein YccC
MALGLTEAPGETGALDGAMNVPTWRDWVFALNVLFAAIMAMGIALWVDLPKPYWAVSTVVITSQPFAGATRAKAAYRVYGTLIGAVAAVVLVPNLVDAPELLSLSIAIWVGFGLYVSLLHRTSKSYVMMLAGYTAAFIGFPDVGDPGSIFDVAVARAEEITLGILCAAVVGSVILPRSIVPALRCRLDQWFADAYDWIKAVLAQKREGLSQFKRIRLACGAIAFDALTTTLKHDLSGAESSLGALATLRQHMLMLLPVVASIGDRLDELARTGGFSKEIQAAVEDVAVEIKSEGANVISLGRLRDLASATGIGRQLRPDWPSLLRETLSVRLDDLIDLLQDIRALRHDTAGGGHAAEQLRFRYTSDVRNVRHRDHGIALLSAIAAFIAISIASVIWIATGWPDGSACPMMAAVGCSFFAIQDDPAVQIFDLAKSALIGATAAAIYLFAVLPLATSFETLAVAFAPALVASGLLMTQPRTAIIGMGSAVIGFTLLALQENYSADFGSFANTAIAVILGIWIAAGTTRLTRSVGGHWSARRLRGINRRDLARAASGAGTNDGSELAALMLDRVGLIAPRLAALPPTDAEWTSELISEVRVGINLVELRLIRDDLRGPQLDAIIHLMSELAAYFSGGETQPPPGLLSVVDGCLDLVISDCPSDVRRATLLALTDLRRSLFPNAAPYVWGASLAPLPGLAA